MKKLFAEERGKPNFVSEQEMLRLLANSKRVFLLEPNVKRKYLPSGLAKVSGYLKAHGCDVAYGRYFSYSKKRYDLVCLTTCFTYDSAYVHEAIRGVRAIDTDVPILVGGVYATLMPEHLCAGHKNLFIFKACSPVLDMQPPDYSLDYKLSGEFAKYSYLVTTRGCPNNCKYCAVNKLEPRLWINPDWKSLIVDDRPYVMLSDNNLTAFVKKKNHFANVMEYLAALGKPVMFNNGVDNKFVTVGMADMLASVVYRPGGLRLAFDRIVEDGIFQVAVERLLSAGVPQRSIFIFVLYNFDDTPKEAHYRMQECDRLGVWGYPERFIPLDAVSRKPMYVSSNWTANLVRAFFEYWMFKGNRRFSFEDFIIKRYNRGLRVSNRFNERDWEKWESC